MDDSPPPVDKTVTSTARLLIDYFNGLKVDFMQVPVSLDRFSPFSKAVYRRVRAIPYGEVRSYKEIAGLIERPGAARAVGAVMASNPIPVIIPCHRVIAADGKLTGYSAAGGVTAKARLLIMEGLTVSGGKVERKGSASVRWPG